VASHISRRKSRRQFKSLAGKGLSSLKTVAPGIGGWVRAKIPASTCKEVAGVYGVRNHRTGWGPKKEKNIARSGSVGDDQLKSEGGMGRQGGGVPPVKKLLNEETAQRTYF